MKTEQEQIEELVYTVKEAIRRNGTYWVHFDYIEMDNNDVDHAAEESAKELYYAGYRKASDVIDEFVERINLIECEMFHKAHDVRNSCEYKINHGNTDDRVWGDKRACDGKMVAVQDFMTKIKKLAAEMRKEVKNG